MLSKKTLLTAKNLNEAFISKSGSGIQSMSGSLNINGGQMTLKNSLFTDNASSGYLRIDPQGNKVIVYDGVNNQSLEVYGSTGSDAVQISTFSGATSYGMIDVTSSMDHLKIMGNTGKKVSFGGNIEAIDSIWSVNPNNKSANMALSWINNDPRIRIGGTGTGSVGTFRIQGSGDVDRMTLDQYGHAVFTGSIKGSTVESSTATIGGGSAFPLTLKRTASADNLSIEMNLNGTTRYLGIVSNGDLKFGSDANIFGAGQRIWHEGNFNPNSKLDIAGGSISGNLSVSGALNLSTTGIVFPSNPFGGSGDSAGIYLRKYQGTEDQELVIEVQNDANDRVNIISNGNDSLRVNGNRVWNAGNFNPDTKFDKSGGIISGDTGVDGTMNISGNLRVGSAGDGSQPNSAVIGSLNTMLELRSSLGSTSYPQSVGIVAHTQRLATSALTHTTSDASSSYWDFISDDSNYEVRVKGNKMWHAGNDGSGSGLDADKLDGIHISDILANKGITVDSQDWNTILESGIYRVSNYTGINNPLNANGEKSYQWGTLEVLRNGNSVTQNYYTHNGTDRNSGVFTRTMWNTSSDWSPWRTFWTSSNMGSGSGLDADKIDGLQASQFLRNDINETTNGNLTISKSTPSLTLYDNSSSGNTGIIAFGSTANQGVQLRYTANDGEIKDASGYAIILERTPNNIQNYKASLEVEGTIYSEGNKVWHAGNISPLSKTGDSMSGELNFTSSGKGIKFYSSSWNDAGGIRYNYANNDGVMEFWTTDDYSEPFVFNAYDVGTDGSGVKQEWLRIDGSKLSYKGNEVWHTGNDGSGSGLDSDLLDGQEGSYYRNWNNLTNKPSTFAPSSHDHSGNVLKFNDAVFGTGRLGTENNNHPQPMTSLSLALGHSLLSAGTSDMFRFGNVVSVEYYNGTSWVTWNTTAWKNILDGTGNKWWNIGATQKNFRFTIKVGASWQRLSSVIVRQRYQGGEPDYTLMIEGSTDNSTWRTRMPATSNNGAKAIAIYVPTETVDDLYFRLTFNTGATDASQFSLSNVMGLTNRTEYVTNGTGTPLNWDYDQNVAIGGTAGSSAKLLISGGRLKVDGLGSQTIGGGSLNNSWFQVGSESDGVGIDPNEIYFSGGTEGIIGTNSSGVDLKFRPNGTDKMTIKASNGRVGIGTTNPTGMLHVSGPSNTANNGININGLKLDTIDNNLIISNLSEFRFGDSNVWAYNDWAGMKYKSNTGDLIIGGSYSSNLSSGGSTTQRYINVLFEGINNMGVGTGSPRTKLDVNGNIAIPLGASIYIGNNGDTGERLRFHHDSSTTSYIDYGSGSLIIRRGTTNFLTMTNSGSLTVDGSQSITGGLSVSGLISSPASANTKAYQIGDDVGMWDVGVANTLGIYGNQNTAVGAVKLGSTGPTLYGTGNTLGVGTTNPWTSMMLDVNGSMRFSQNNAIYTSYNGNNYAVLKEHNNGTVTVNGASGELFLGYTSTSKVRLTTDLYGTNGTTRIANTDGTLFYKGTDANSLFVSRSGDTMTGTLAISRSGDGAKLLTLNSERAWSFLQSGTGGSAHLALRAETDGKSFKIQGVSGNTVMDVFTTTTGGEVSFGGKVQMQNNNIEGVNTLSGRFGTVFRSNDEWLRINESGDTHTSGVYFGSSIVRTDGELQVGSSGSTFKANSSGITLDGTFNFANTSSTMKVQGETILSFLPDNYGRGVLFGGNQSTYILAGDGANTWANANGNAHETVYLTADNNVKIATDVNNGTPSFIWEFDNLGALNTPYGNGVKFDTWGNIVQRNAGTAWRVKGSDGGDNLTVELGVNGMTHVNNLRIKATGDASETSTGHGFQIGPTSGSRLIMDDNEIMSLNGSSFSGLYISSSDLQWDRGSGGIKVARIRWGTGGPPSSNAYDGDIYVQY